MAETTPRHASAGGGWHHLERAVERSLKRPAGARLGSRSCLCALAGSWRGLTAGWRCFGDPPAGLAADGGMAETTVNRKDLS